MTDALIPFSPPVQHWFRATFGEPTAPQHAAWPPIQRGENTLILAPTGSGKTLAAFLWGIDQVGREEMPKMPTLGELASLFTPCGCTFCCIDSSGATCGGLRCWGE